MNKIYLDQHILEKEADKLRVAARAYAKGVSEGSGKLSENFQRQAAAMFTIVESFVESLEATKRYSVLERLNANNEGMLFFPREDLAFSNTKEELKFHDLCECAYKHKEAKGVFGPDENKTIAKKALHDYVDATALFDKALKNKTGPDVNPIVFERFTEVAHKFIDADHGNVVPFAPRKRLAAE